MAESAAKCVYVKINDLGINLIKNYEGLKLTAYQDSVGIWTIGYGETGPLIIPGLVWTKEQAEKSFIKRVKEFADRLTKIIFTSLNDNQFSALVSLAYNVGIANVKKSTLLALINLGDYKGASEEFIKWNKAGGKVLAGLTKRRQAEKELFLKV